MRRGAAEASDAVRGRARGWCRARPVAGAEPVSPGGRQAAVLARRHRAQQDHERKRRGDSDRLLTIASLLMRVRRVAPRSRGGASPGRAGAARRSESASAPWVGQHAAPTSIDERRGELVVLEPRHQPSMTPIEFWRSASSSTIDSRSLALERQQIGFAHLAADQPGDFAHHFAPACAPLGSRRHQARASGSSATAPHASARCSARSRTLRGSARGSPRRGRDRRHHDALSSSASLIL